MKKKTYYLPTEGSQMFTHSLSCEHVVCRSKKWLWTQSELNRNQREIITEAISVFLKDLNETQGMPQAMSAERDLFWIPPSHALECESKEQLACLLVVWKTAAWNTYCGRRQVSEKNLFWAYWDLREYQVG